MTTTATAHKVLIPPSMSYTCFGIAQGIDNVGDHVLIAISGCCLLPVEWSSSGNQCSACKRKGVDRGFTDSTTLLDDSTDGWIEAWTQLRPVKVEVEW